MKLSVVAGGRTARPAMPSAEPPDRRRATAPRWLRLLPLLLAGMVAIALGIEARLAVAHAWGLQELKRLLGW